jgi:hypothetical protein
LGRVGAGAAPKGRFKERAGSEGEGEAPAPSALKSLRSRSLSFLKEVGTET